MRVKLGEVCKVVSGTTPKSSCPEYWNGTLNWVTPAELKDDSDIVYETERKITLRAVQDTGLKPFPIGTVLLSSRAPIGKVAISGREMYCNQGFKNLVCSGSIYNRYLYHFLKDKTEYLNALGRGATFKEISKDIVENIEIPLPPLETQRHIAAVLDKVSALIAKRRHQLDKLDELVKSRFVEMFGDMVSNVNQFSVSQLGIVCDVRDGTHDTPQYCERGYPLVTSKNVTGGKIDLSSCGFISEEDFLAINKRSKVDEGDIIMPMIGTIGKPVIVSFEPHFAIKNVALIKFPPGAHVKNIYIKTLLESDYFDRMVLAKIHGGTQKFISLGDIRNLKIAIPPIDLQNQFAAFVTQTEKTKAAVQQALEKLETLKKALMQEYFG